MLRVSRKIQLNFSRLTQLLIRFRSRLNESLKNQCGADYENVAAEHFKFAKFSD